MEFTRPWTCAQEGKGREGGVLSRWRIPIIIDFQGHNTTLAINIQGGLAKRGAKFRDGSIGQRENRIKSVMTELGRRSMYMGTSQRDWTHARTWRFPSGHLVRVHRKGSHLMLSSILEPRQTGRLRYAVLETRHDADRTIPLGHHPSRRATSHARQVTPRQRITQASGSPSRRNARALLLSPGEGEPLAAVT